jgi:hypothetical protein
MQGSTVLGRQPTLCAAQQGKGCASAAATRAAAAARLAAAAAAVCAVQCEPIRTQLINSALSVNYSCSSG